MSRDILVSLVDPDPGQLRKHFDEDRLDELAQSMAANGLAIPILVRPGQDGRYVIVHGERRWRAAGRLGWEAIPAEVRDLTVEQARWLALVENIQRADLSPIEEAQAYQAALSDGMTQTELGKRIGKSQSYIAQKVRLLTLPRDVQEAVDSRQLSEGHARQLLRLRKDGMPAGLAENMANRAMTRTWTVRRLELHVDFELMVNLPQQFYSDGYKGRRFLLGYRFSDLEDLLKRLEPFLADQDDSLTELHFATLMQTTEYQMFASGIWERTDGTSYLASILMEKADLLAWAFLMMCDRRQRKYGAGTLFEWMKFPYVPVEAKQDCLHELWPDIEWLPAGTIVEDPDPLPVNFWALVLSWCEAYYDEHIRARSTAT